MRIMGLDGKMEAISPGRPPESRFAIIIIKGITGAGIVRWAGALAVFALIVLGVRQRVIGSPEAGRPAAPEDGGELILKNTTDEPSGLSVHDKIAAESIIIDLHNDAVTQIYEREDLSLFDGRELEASLPHLLDGGLKAAFFAVWTPEDEGPGYEDDLIETFFTLLDGRRDEILFAADSGDLEKNVAQNKLSAFLAVEGGAALAGDLDRLDYLYARGARYMTLTWNQSNDIADAAKDRKKPNSGLSPFGERVVKRMNGLGMIVDVSHVSDQAVDDVLAVSEDPVIASHSNCYAVRRHYRNLKDRHIAGICETGGVIGVNFHGTFLKRGRPAVISDVVDHIDHVVKIGGVDCVALGSDFDGRIKPPKGLKNMGELENLTEELTRRGYSEGDIKKIYGLNFIRVLKRVVDR
jgi:membrane dipeptidase